MSTHCFTAATVIKYLSTNWFIFLDETYINVKSYITYLHHIFISSQLPDEYIFQQN